MKFPQKIIFGHFSIVGLVVDHFGLLGQKDSPPIGKTVNYHKTEGIQS